MLRMSQYIREARQGVEARSFNGAILIWNLTDSCNLSCAHCYANAVRGRGDELPLERVRELAPELYAAGVRVVIVSGGEPLLRRDIYDVAQVLSEAKLAPQLSTNGLLITRENVQRIGRTFGYVGISIDGEPAVHDHFRGRRGAYERSLESLRLCRDHGIKVGLRFTLTAETQPSLPFVLALAREERIPKVYISHLVTSGRGESLKPVSRAQYLEAIGLILECAFSSAETGLGPEIVTGNNESDAVFLLREFSRRYPDKAHALRKRLETWGGNQAGVRLLNLDAHGRLRPDPFFTHELGDLRTQHVSEALSDQNELLTALRHRPRQLEGRCAGCEHLTYCNGNSRARAYAATGSYTAEDPGCFVTL